MEFIKKQSAGFYLSLLTIILAFIGIMLYFGNCKTAYFSNLGMNTTEDVEKWVEVRKNKKKLEDLTNKGVIEEEEEIPSEVEEAIE